MFRIGEEHHNSKLTEDDVRNARYLYHVSRPQAKAVLAGLTIEGLAEKFGVGEKAMRDVINYRTWIHVPDINEETRER